MYRDPISMAILNLQENGRIQLLYNKWWRNTGTCNNDDKKQESNANPLGLENVGGIFVVLITGLSLAVIAAVVEFIWNSRKNAAADRVCIASQNTMIKLTQQRCRYLTFCLKLIFVVSLTY